MRMSGQKGCCMMKRVPSEGVVPFEFRCAKVYIRRDLPENFCWRARMKTGRQFADGAEECRFAPAVSTGVLESRDATHRNSKPHPLQLYLIAANPAFQLLGGRGTVRSQLQINTR